MEAENAKSEIEVCILVVDENPEIRAAFHTMLAGEDVTVVEASGGEEALLALLRDEFAVVFVAVVMEGMSGLDLARLIRERQKTRNLPIVFMTGLATTLADALEGYALGAFDYLLHPLIPEVVRAKVATLVELYRARKEIEQQKEEILLVQRRQAEIDLLELRLASERRYRSLVDAVPHIVFTLRPDGALDYLNQRWFEYTGMPRAETKGRLSAAMHPDDVEPIQRRFDEALRRRDRFEFDCRLRRGTDGAYHFHICRAAPEIDAFGEIVAWIGTFTDVDEARRDHQNLVDFHATLDAVHDAVLLLEPESKEIIYANEGASLLFGLSPDQLVHRSLEAFVTEVDLPRFQELLRSLKGDEARSETLEVRCSRPDGSTSPAELLVQVIAGDVSLDRGARAIVIARDTTERQREEAERELLYRNALEAIRARDEFLSIASHELKTPLTALSLQLHALSRPRRSAETGEPEVPAPVLGKLQFAHRQVERLTRLLNELLDVSRIHAGKLGIEVEDVDLAQLVREVAERFADSAAKVGSELILTANEVCVGRWDRIRIEQVVVNLVSNALKFGAGKPIEIRVEPCESMARLIVRDHGIGIEPGEVERIFSRFERAVSSKSYAGLGLGLYIVRQIVAAHDGQIHVESHPGEGATFLVELPAVCSKERRAEEEIEEADGGEELEAGEIHEESPSSP